MDDVIFISDDSENSVVEVEVPKRPTPPLIEIEDEEIILNIAQNNKKNILAKDFIKQDKKLSVMSIKKNPRCLNSSPNHWTTDMIKFYDDDWGNEEEFVVEKIQEKMDKTPLLWKISRKDVLNMHNKRRKSNIKCLSCNQHGHNLSACPNSPLVSKCHMCGTEGHEDYTCPYSKCLNCGNYSREYVICCNKCRDELNEICSRCSVVGHNFINCPDHWRLFHMTTVTTSVVVPNKNVYKLSKDMWCCNCGRKGHYSNQCSKRKCSAFKDTLPYVVSYQKAFNDNQPLLKPQFKPEAYGVFKKKHFNESQKQKDELAKTLRLNPMNKRSRKDKTFLKNKFKNYKKFKKNKKKKRESRCPWNTFIF